MPVAASRRRLTAEVTSVNWLPGRDRLLFGYHMPSQTFPGVPTAELFERIAANVAAAEAAGFDLVTVMDHFYQIPPVGPEDEPMLEAYTLLGGLAARTSRIGLSCMVTGVTYRNPALLATQVTTLDVISNGRATLGLGAAWNEGEHIGLGFEFPPVGERMDRLEEAVQICRLMFTEERPSFSGRYYRIERALNHPRPIQDGGPPILIGGSGERRTLRIVARYADMSNWFGALDELRHKAEVLDGYCAEIGRDPASILRTVTLPIVLVESHGEDEAVLGPLTPERRAATTTATPSEAVDLLQPYIDLGFHGFFFRNQGMMEPERIALASELIASMQRTPVSA
jgi:F420-dependent oxidoreductase-like protein